MVDNSRKNVHLRGNNHINGEFVVLGFNDRVMFTIFVVFEIGSVTIMVSPVTTVFPDASKGAKRSICIPIPGVTFAIRTTVSSANRLKT